MSSARQALAALLLLVAAALPRAALAQSSPNWTYSYVPTQAEWNAAFAGKQDVLAAPPLLTTGGTMTGPLITAAPTTTTAGINLPPGSAPTSPNNGDLWTTTGGVFARINGATINLTGAASTSFAATAPLAVSFPSSIVTYAVNYDSTLRNDGGSLGLNTIAANSLLGNSSGSAGIGVVSVPGCVGAASALQWTSGTGFNCGTITAAASSVTVGTTTVSGGPGVLYNSTSGGALSALAAVNSSVVSFSSGGALQASMTLPSGLSATNLSLTTPTLGAASGTSLALGGATLGGNALAVTGTTSLGGALTYGGVTLSNSVTGTGPMVLGTSPALTTPNLGTPSAVTLTNGTGLPISSGVSGLGTGVATALGVNGGSAGAMSVLIAGGTIAMPTSAVASNTCGSAATATATGTLTTDEVDASFNSDPSGTVGFEPPNVLSILVYPTANTFNAKYCNSTTSSITPGAITLNWKVRR